VKGGAVCVRWVCAGCALGVRWVCAGCALGCAGCLGARVRACACVCLRARSSFICGSTCPTPAVESRWVGGRWQSKQPAHLMGLPSHARPAVPCLLSHVSQTQLRRAAIWRMAKWKCQVITRHTGFNMAIIGIAEPWRE